LHGWKRRLSRSGNLYDKETGVRITTRRARERVLSGERVRGGNVAAGAALAKSTTHAFQGATDADRRLHRERSLRSSRRLVFFECQLVAAIDRV
jgi:hypothetical protein